MSKLIGCTGATQFSLTLLTVLSYLVAKHYEGQNHGFSSTNQRY